MTKKVSLTGIKPTGIPHIWQLSGCHQTSFEAIRNLRSPLFLSPITMR